MLINRVRKVNLDYDSTPSYHHQFNFNISKRYIEDKIVLDIGCWTGQFEALAVNNCKKITGIDPNKEAVRFAKKLTPGANFKVGNALELSFKNNSFDVITMFDVMEHLPKGSELKALKEVKRLLKRNGTFILSTPNKNIFSILGDPAYFLEGHRHYSIKELDSLFAKAGLEVMHIFKTGGFARISSHIFELVFKLIFRTKLKLPKFIRNRIKSEYKKGFAQIHLVAKSFVKP